MQLSKDSRATQSCTECQRRKQKCSREWPCNHCQARKVAHLCQFGVKKIQQESPPESTRESPGTLKGRKRCLPESTEDSQPSSQEVDGADLEDGLKVWGYMPGHVHYKLNHADDASTRKDSPRDVSRPSEVDKVLHAIPPRSITDAFVNHFLAVVNYRYSTIYGPTLTDQYVDWWSSRAAGKRLSPEFTCLLLRVCAYTVQFLTPALRKMVEFEMACDSQVLSERFSAAAEQLTQSFEASHTTIERVQEQFLKGVWLKSESKIVESWHALGCTIREAQELGIDRDANIEGLSEFDIEIRRRIWTLLYIWDWQMSAWLGRPNLIDQKNLTFRFPNLRLDQSKSDPNLLSPFAHMALQAHLGRRVGAALGQVGDVKRLTASETFHVESECDNFINELPAIFRVENPDTSFDEQHPYFIFQRYQLHCVIFVTKLDFLKPYLTRLSSDKLTDQDDVFRKMGIDTALRLLEVARRLFDHEFPINAKFHMVVFSIFDTATLLCSAIIHDREMALPRREEVKDAITNSLEMLHQLSLTTKIGASSYAFLQNLVQATPALCKRAAARKRQRQEVLPAANSVPLLAPEHLPNPAPANVNTVTAASGTYGAVSAPTSSTADDLCFDMDQFLASNPFGAYSTPANLDMGGMEQIWDWEDLRLDGFSQTGSTA